MKRLALISAALAMSACAPPAARPDAGACMTAAERAELLDQVAALQARLDRHAAAQAEAAQAAITQATAEAETATKPGPTEPSTTKANAASTPHPTDTADAAGRGRERVDRRVYACLKCPSRRKGSPHRQHARCGCT